MLLRWKMGIWGLIFGVTVLHSIEPDFERLFPISPYEQIHQTLIKVWEQQGKSEQQIYQLTKLIELINGLKSIRSQVSKDKQNSSDLDYQVRLLDFIQLSLIELEPSKNSIKTATNNKNQVLKLLAKARIALLELN